MKIFSLGGMIILLLSFILILGACSNNRIPVMPIGQESSNQQYELPQVEESNRSIIAVYDAVIDPVAQTFTITLEDRICDYHFPLTQYYPNVLSIVNVGWTPNFWADIKLTHPYPGSGIKGYDPRVIAIVPARTGVSFNYPVMNAVANNKVVLEPDGYTKVFDNLGGSIAGNTNPFKAYFKNQPYRVWSSTGVTSETQRWNLNLAGFGGSLSYKLVVDVSTNYPNSPQPIIDNAPEPVQIEATIGTGLTTSGGSANIEVILTDWQGNDRIGGAIVESPQLFSGTIPLAYDGMGPEDYTYVYAGAISNALHAPEGKYNLLIASWDKTTNIYTYKEYDVYVQDIVSFNPTDVTPQGLHYLSFYIDDISISGNYAYFAADSDGLYIFDISDPLNPEFVNVIPTAETAIDVQVSGGYACIADGEAGLTIIDVDPPESAYLVKTVSIDVYSYASIVETHGAYAYVGDSGYNNLCIFDIDPPESTYKAGSVAMPYSVTGIDVSSTGYACVTVGYQGTQIVDIDPPESASIVKSISTPGEDYSVCISGGYAAVASGYAGVRILDIDPPASAYEVKTVPTYGAMDISVTGGYAYVADSSALQIIDINPPGSSYIVKTVSTSGSTKVQLSGGFAYAAGGNILDIIDIEPIESAYVANTVQYRGYPTLSVDVANDYAFEGCDCILNMIDIEPPESAYRGGSCYLTSVSDLRISDDYLYAIGGSWSQDLNIIDIIPPETPAIVKTVDLYYAKEVDVEGGYAFVVDGDLRIVDVDPPENAFVVKTIATPDYACGICVMGDYAYVADGSALQIVSLQSLSIVKSVTTTTYIGEVDVSNGYACVGYANANTMDIIDVEPPLSAQVISSINTGDSIYDIDISGNYAYIASGSSGLTIVDISPPEAPEVVCDFPLAYMINLSVKDNYVYAACSWDGFRIIKLW